MRRVLTIGILLLGAGPAAGQTQSSLDSAARAEYRDLLLDLRAAVDRVSAQTNEFRRDLRSVGEATVMARASRLATVCRETRKALSEARPRLGSARLEPHQVVARDSLFIAMAALSTSLERECQRGLGSEGPGSRADTLRAWGPHRTSLLAQAVSGFHGAAARFARRLGVDLTRR